MSTLSALEGLLSPTGLARLETRGARVDDGHRVDRNTHVRALKALGLPVHGPALALEDAVGGLSVGRLRLGASFALDQARRSADWVVGEHWTFPLGAGVVPAGRIDGDVVTIDAQGRLADGDDVAGGPLADSHTVLLERFDLEIADDAAWRIGLELSCGELLAPRLAIDAAPEASDSLARVWRDGDTAVVDACSDARRSYRCFPAETTVFAAAFGPVRAALEVAFAHDANVGVRVYRPAPRVLATSVVCERVMRGVPLSGGVPFELCVTRTGLARRDR